MKILVIHPIDHTTDFLSYIYNDKNHTVIRSIPGRSVIKTLIRDHDMIIFLGHGTEYGLINQKQYVIDSRLVYLLKDKPCIYIWCNADQFVKKYSLCGIYTGMIVSDCDEADEFINHIYNQNDINKSNELLAKTFGDNFSYDLFDMYNNVIDTYKSIETNHIIEFNKENIYYKKQQNG